MLREEPVEGHCGTFGPNAGDVSIPGAPVHYLGGDAGGLGEVGDVLPVARGQLGLRVEVQGGAAAGGGGGDILGGN